MYGRKVRVVQGCSVNVSERTTNPRWKDNIKMELNEIESEGVDLEGSSSGEG
jgi:hypothetical protein